MIVSEEIIFTDFSFVLCSKRDLIDSFITLTYLDYILKLLIRITFNFSTVWSSWSKWYLGKGLSINDVTLGGEGGGHMK